MTISQLDLLTWKGPGARRSDPDTSQAAAARIRPAKVYHEILNLLRSAGPLTDFEIAARLGGQQTSLGKRRGELRDAGLVVDSGERRPSPSGSSAIVWKLAEGA